MFYVINMDGQHERLQHMSEAISRMGLEYHRVEAVVGRDLPAEELERWCPEVGTFRRLLPAEIGCFLSHRRAWKLFLETPSELAVVFEDDVVFSGDAEKILRDLSWVPSDADIVRLEAWLSRSVVDIKPASTVAGREIRRLWSVQYGAAAYVITRQGAEKALRLTETFGDAVDDALFNPETPFSSQITIYQMVPAICVQDKRLNKDSVRFPSGIEHERRGRPDRPKGMALVWREIERSWKKSVVRPMRMSVRNVLGRRRWMRIRFE